MRKVSILFDYGTWPVWYQDEDMECRVPDLPPCVEDNEELNRLMREIKDEYEGLFINNSYEFTFVGFKNEESYLRFRNKVNEFVKKLKKAVEPQYVVDTSSWDIMCRMGTLLDDEV